MTTRIKLIGLVAALALATVSTLAAREDQRTELTVHQAIEVPGAVLPPGDYVIELAEASVDETVVLFRDAETNKVKATAMTIDAVADAVPNDTKFVFYDMPDGNAPALRTWYYPGDIRGHEFIYPESRGKEIAKAARRHVPTVADSDFTKMSAARESKTGEPLLVAVHDVRVYSLSPDSEKTSLEKGRKMNAEADARMWKPDKFVRGREVPESRLERQIRKEIVTLPFYSLWDHIEYHVDGGQVTLMGSVYRPSMKKSVERAVKNVEGVQSVDNRVTIQPTSSFDDSIRMSAYRAIYGHPALQNYQLRAVPPIHIIVENGKITLEGVVQNRMDKNVAGIQANSVSGAFEVVNNLRTES